MKIGLGRRYAAYVTLLMVAVVTAALLAAGVIAFRLTSVLEQEIQDALAAAESARAEESLKGTAAYLSNRLFNPLQRLDVERLNDEIEQVRLWLPVTRFVVTDPERRLLTDGTPAIEGYGDRVGGSFPLGAPWTPLLETAADGRELRFAIHSGDVVAGWAVVTLAEDPLRASLRHMEERTGGLWRGFRSSLLYLGGAVLLLTLLLGGVTSAWLSRTLARPLTEMSRAARRFAAGDLEHGIALDSPDELGELELALNTMARDLRGHEAERERLIADLESKNAELERFSYTVSHDLKSPLVTVLGFAGLVEADLEAGRVDRARDGLARIAAAGERMHGLLEDLLELSRIGRIVNPPEDASMAELAREAVEMVRGRLDERGVRVEIAADLPSVRGDRQRLREVLQNLVENAAKFMGPQRSPLVQVGVRPGNPEPVFFVRDNGQGLDMRYQDKLFRLFEKLDPRGEGTGVGLALVRRIVEAHGGRVWVESDGPGTGATFCFTVPTPADHS